MLDRFDHSALMTQSTFALITLRLQDGEANLHGRHRPLAAVNGRMSRVNRIVELVDDFSARYRRHRNPTAISLNLTSAITTVPHLVARMGNVRLP